jgi:predicted TPR repeat methyltransferase
VPSSEIERRVGEYYTGRLEEHGPTARGVDWNSETSQRLRFEQLLKVAPEEGPFSINDYGCGYGALLDHLDDQGRAVRYHGYDISEAMVAQARLRHGYRADASFCTDLAQLEPADVTVASGIFNVIAGTGPDGWEQYVLSTVRQLACLSVKGLAFNMLTTYSDADRMTDRLYYANPERTFAWCKAELSRHVALLHDYGLYEFTIIVRLEEGVGPA